MHHKIASGQICDSNQRDLKNQHVHPEAWNFVHWLPRYVSTIIYNCCTDGSIRPGNYGYKLKSIPKIQYKIKTHKEMSKQGKKPHQWMLSEFKHKLLLIIIIIIIIIIIKLMYGMVANNTSTWQAITKILNTKIKWKINNIKVQLCKGMYRTENPHSYAIYQETDISH
jgi:hypothetical protein